MENCTTWKIQGIAWRKINGNVAKQRGGNMGECSGIDRLASSLQRSGNETAEVEISSL